jgi:hypothetical protein
VATCDTKYLPIKKAVNYIQKESREGENQKGFNMPLFEADIFNASLAFI